MRIPCLAFVAVLAGLISPVDASTNPLHSRQLTFDDRVRAQEAIERVYYSHQIGARRPFGEAVTRELLERKVNAYLKQSAALEAADAGRLTAEMLEDELARIARDTRLPDRLQEIYGALGSDPVLVLECFVRPLLVEKLTRDTSAESLLADPGAVPTLANEESLLPSPAPNSPFSPQDCSSDDTWDNGSLAPAQEEGRRDHTAVWTGSLMLVWGGGDSNLFSHGLKYDPLTDLWGSITTVGAPTPRFRHAAVWTGSEMLVWGGQAQTVAVGTGGRYDPVTDTWLPISTVAAPGPRYFHTGTWTGSSLIIWGGLATSSISRSDGARYDPVADTWVSVSNHNAPVRRSSHTSIWTGDEMIVWGGRDGATFLGSGGRYDPSTDTWTPTSVVNAPSSRNEHKAVWTGDEMIVWGGSAAGGLANTGGRYNPIADTWQSTSIAGAPNPRDLHTAVWTGSRMIIYGGADCCGPSVFASGGLYDPATDTWTATSVTGAPSERALHSAIWTGSLMVVWGGVGAFLEEVRETGGRFDPVTNTWAPTSLTSGHVERRRYHSAVWTGNEMLIWGGAGEDFNSMSDGFRYNPLTDTATGIQVLGAPGARERHTAVWTGDEMVVWGGQVFTGTTFAYLGDGARYDPIANAWSPVSANGNPTARHLHTAVWTGDEMILWGGFDTGNIPRSDGARYDPDTDTWTPVSSQSAPVPRYRHTSTWTGSAMIVWGGRDASTIHISGGRYDPVSDTWQPTTLSGAPSARTTHTAVWTGRRMIIWGGVFGTQRLQTGAGYDPIADSWTPTSLVNAPLPRSNHTAVWSGSRMIIWGGSDSSYFNSGGRYDPRTDAWSPTSTLNAPSDRAFHTAVWTGAGMIVWGGLGSSGWAPGNTGGRYTLLELPDADGDGSPLCAGDCDDQEPAIYPGAPQICDGINNDCVSSGWPALAGTNEADGDGDTLTSCQGDCDDADADAWSTPSEVSDVTLRADGVTIDWIAPSSAGGSWLAFDTLRSQLANDFTGGAACIEYGDGADLMSFDGSVPGAGSVYYYLVRAMNGCPGSLGVGLLGADSNGTLRTGRNCP